ncbi:MAG: sporulation integral membrane protein YtvI [Firmicutes bacterium]|jgi:sporulation integral membrane protein YtvI|nr:sporulation integral membrane protein YtvI [Bacillota bacterium]
MNRQVLYILGAVFFLIILYLGLRYLLPLILPFAFGGFLALMLEPMVNFLQKKVRMPRSWAAGITIISAVVISALLLVLLTARVAVDIRDITYKLPVYSKTMIETLQDWTLQTQAFYVRLPEPLMQTVEEGIKQLYNIAGILLRKVLGSLSAVPNLIFSLILSFIAAFFISRDRAQLSAIIHQLLSPAGIERMQILEREIMTSLVGLVWAHLILVTITTLVAMVGLWVLGIRYAVFIGLISGLLDIIPVLGPTLLFLPWIIAVLISGNVTLAIGLTVVYATMNIIRQILQAKIIGTRTGLHPLAVLVSLYVGVKLFGPNGIIVGPLMLILFRALLRLGIFGDLTRM